MGKVKAIKKIKAQKEKDMEDGLNMASQDGHPQK
jgi:hypothetical protein